jgi:hypothetical protein
VNTGRHGTFASARAAAPDLEAEDRERREDAGDRAGHEHPSGAHRSGPPGSQGQQERGDRGQRHVHRVLAGQRGADRPELRNGRHEGAQQDGSAEQH